MKHYEVADRIICAVAVIWLWLSCIHLLAKAIGGLFA